MEGSDGMEFMREKETEGNRINGLSEKEAKSLLNKYGYNVFANSSKISPLKLFAGQFKDILILILIASTVLSVLMGEFSEAVAILLIIFLNAVLGFAQEYRTEKTIEALKNMAAPTARVYREGKIRQIPAAEVAPKDIIVLEAGDRVPSDAKLLESYGLQVDESLLTGESVPVEKSTSIDAGGASDKVYMGTMVTKGKARAFTVATGMQTEMGKIAGMLTDIEGTQTPLQKRLDQLGKYIAVGCLAVCAIVSVTGIIRGEPVFNMILTGISLAVAAVPEGLPAIVTIALALGVRRMLKRNALVRKLMAVETLGCASVVCSDKTGTLTENKMTVKHIFTLDHQADVTGNGYEPEGNFIIDGSKRNPGFYEDIISALEISAVCSNARVEFASGGKGPFRLFKGKKQQKIDGDPTEAALIVAAAKAGLSVETLNRKYYRTGEAPFDSERKCMSVTVESGTGANFLFVKGAPDIIAEKCNFIRRRGKNVLLDSGTRQKIEAANNKMADMALRVLAVAYRELPDGCGASPDAERNLVFTGLIGMMDPPRAEAYRAVAKCLKAGIKPVMITGDHKNTAAAIAKELGILKEGEMVMTGRELDSIGWDELSRLAPKVSVYARVSPSHKLKIVRCYKQLGNIVAMTGDGVNDAPAVKEADIGVSMGLTGTDVTKEASAIILLDDNFASMIAAIEEGRVIYQNIRKFIRYLISCNIGEVLTMFAGMIMGMPVVLVPIQILWVNLVTDGLPAIALGMEPPEDDVMEQSPRGAEESIFSGGLGGLMLFRGCIIAVSTLGSFVSVFKMTNDISAARTAAFTTLVFVQLVHVFECKSEKKNIFRIPFFNNPFLIFSALISLAMMLAAVYIPYLRPIFGTVPLDFKQMLYVLGYTMIGPILSAIVFSGRKRLGGFSRQRVAGLHKK